MTSPTLERMIRAGCYLGKSCDYPDCHKRQDCPWRMAVQVYTVISTLDTPDDALIEAMADAVLDNHYPNSPRDPQMYRIARPIARAALRAAVNHILGRKP